MSVQPIGLATAPVRVHAGPEEYFDWLDRTFSDAPPGRRRRPSVVVSRRYFYNRFTKTWPDLEDWFHEPLLVRLDLQDRDQWQSGHRLGPSQDGGSYLTYMSMVHHIPMDSFWVLSRNFGSMFRPAVAEGMGVDLPLLRTWVDRMVALGYATTALASVTWGVSRLALWRGDPDITAITTQDIHEFREELRRYCADPVAGFIRATHVSNARRQDPMDMLAAQFEKACQTRLYGLQVLLFDIGQVSDAPIHGLRSEPKWITNLIPEGTPPQIAVPVRRWLELRMHASGRSETVRQARDAFRYLIRWLVEAHQEITNLGQLTRTHMEEYLIHLGHQINKRTNRPLSAQTRYAYLSPLLAFFRETSQWGWPDVPARQVLGRSDMPKLPARLPRYIPRDELDRLMAAVEQLTNPFQRTALLVARWSGARRGEIARLTVDCLDTYPDGYPRLRIPVGKTYTERAIPLHPQAADALRDLIERATDVNAAAWTDPFAGQKVQHVFVNHGRPLSKSYLFTEPLAEVCATAGLLNAAGKPTVSAHRFRHTVGTQLAEGGARIQTIMAILGHRSARMSMTYSHISDPVLKEQYERIIANGGGLAGPAARALLNNELDQPTIDWLKTNFLKTELELGHCLRLPSEGPCECDLYLRCSKFFTTSEYVPRLQARLAKERELIQDATQRNWPREVERHESIARRLEDLLNDLENPCHQA